MREFIGGPTGNALGDRRPWPALHGYVTASEMSSYYHSVLLRALAVQPSLVADEALFQVLLLALVSKRQSVIVRAPEKAKVLSQIVNVSLRLSLPRAL